MDSHRRTAAATAAKRGPLGREPPSERLGWPVTARNSSQKRDRPDAVSSTSNRWLLQPATPVGAAEESRWRCVCRQCFSRGLRRTRQRRRRCTGWSADLVERRRRRKMAAAAAAAVVRMTLAARQTLRTAAVAAATAAAVKAAAVAAVAAAAAAALV